jgi:hypothetical protein
MWQKLGSIDSRVVHGLMIAVIVIALLKPMGLSLAPGSDTKKVYDIIEKLPPKSIIFLGFDYTAGAIPEIGPSVTSMMTQGFRKDFRFVAMGIYSNMGGDLANDVWNVMKQEFPNKKYGVDFVNLGYKPGDQVLLQRLVASVAEASAGSDYYGNKIETLPLMGEFKTVRDAKAIATFFTGMPDRDYVKHIAQPFNIPLICSTWTGGIPTVLPLYQSGQVAGIVTGMRGSAEYELLVGKPGSAVSGMDVQSLSHLLVVVFIIMGNLSYIMTRRQKARG